VKDRILTEGESFEQPLATDDELSVETLKEGLTGEVPISDSVRQEYARQLLDHALHNRDAEASNMLAQAMENDPALDKLLDPILNDTLHEQPDAVYAFVRAYLAANFNPRWLPRLKLAAMYSLRVAINDTSTETIVNWLTLIAREPQPYDLNEVLHFGILGAQTRAHEDGELARQLVTLAARRDPASLDALLGDSDFLNALPNNIGRVLRDYTGDPLMLMQNKGLEIFLVGMARAAKAGVGAIFTPPVIARIWEIYSGEQGAAPGLPPSYQPEAIIQTLIASGSSTLSSEALQSLAALILENRRDDLIIALLEQEDGRTVLLPNLLKLLEQSQRPVSDRLSLIVRMVNAEYLLPQQAVDDYSAMLEKLEAQEDVLLVTQQIARTLQQFPAVTVTAEMMWNLLSLGAEFKDEMVARVMVKSLLTEAKNLETEVDVAESLRRICAQVLWSETVRQSVTTWWRDYIRAQPLTRLGRLEKALEGKKVLEEERGILQTLSAIRKMMGQRTLEDFADNVNAAYNLLQALAESFDTPAKRALDFDALIARMELDGHWDQISPQKRQILANDLKELAQIIAAMGDNRTRANLMRRGDDLDRDLISGEQTPHSAVDSMKWLSGYWGGTKTTTSS
jgi:hypothetical protein